MAKPNRPRKTPSTPAGRRSRLAIRVMAGAAIAVALAVGLFALRPHPPTQPDSSASPIASSDPLLEPEESVFARYAGSASCRECHEKEHASWAASNHGLAERLPDDTLDRPAFDPPQSFTHGSQHTEVRVEDGALVIAARGLGGQTAPRRVERVIGHDPLRQFLVAEPGGRLQTMEASWDPRARAWFNVFGEEDRQPGEWGHWTGRGMNWNSMCGTCHNTRYRKNYDPATDSYHTAMAERTVGCEACHGPMRDHVSWQRAWRDSGRKDPTLMPATPARHMESCAPCHARRAELTGDFAPGDSFWDHYLLSIVDGTDVFYPDGQVREEDYEYAPFLGSRMHAAGVTCLDCHDPHAAAPKTRGNALCMSCHDGTRPGSPVIDPLRHSFHLPDSTGSQCVQCHMPVTTYMQRDPRHDHGFTSPDPLLTLQHGIPNACNRCHADKDAAWALAACETWYGPRMDRPARRRTQAMAAARRGDPAAVDALVALLGTPETPYWKAAALALLEPWIDRPNVTEAAMRQLAHEHPLVRYRAVQALGPRVVPEQADVVPREAVRARLDDPSRAVRVTAATVLRHEVAETSRAGSEMLHMLALNADQPGGQAQWAAYALARGRLPEATERYARAVAWDPGSPPLRHDYAVVLSMGGRSDEALAQTVEAARIQPEVADHHYRLGLAWNETGNLARALVALEEAVRLDPRHDRALYNLGLAYQATGRTSEALEALLRAEGANPVDPRIPYARATLLVQAGRLDDARQALGRVLALDREFQPALELQRVLRP